MKKNIIDYLHLYLGCEVEFTYCKETGIDKDMEYDSPHTLNVDILQQFHIGAIKDLKLILRPITDMTTEEKLHFHETFGYSVDSNDENYAKCLILDIGEPEVWLWLLKQGFDLFELIEAGLAIDKTKM